MSPSEIEASIHVLRITVDNLIVIVRELHQQNILTYDNMKDQLAIDAILSSSFQDLQKRMARLERAHNYGPSLN